MARVDMLGLAGPMRAHAGADAGLVTPGRLIHCRGPQASITPSLAAALSGRSVERPREPTGSVTR